MDNQQFQTFIKIQEEILNTLKHINKNQIDMMYLIKRSKYGDHTNIGYCKTCNRNVAMQGCGIDSKCIHCNQILNLKFEE